MSVGSEFIAAPSEGGFRVGAWTVEPALHQISTAGNTVKIEPRAMAVLSYLAQRPGQVVSRDALLSAVWTGMVVGDDAVTQVVVKLRKALGDVAENPAYIQTISKGGYRLIAPVRGSAEDRSAQAPSDFMPRVERKWHALGLAAASCALLLLAAAEVLRRESAPVSVVREPAATGAIGLASRPSQPIIAIMPFETVSNDAQEVSLARGITADLVNDLSKMSGLWVIRLASSGGRTDRSLSSDAAPIRYLVSGTVQRDNERMRLHVHLADAQTGKQLWSERFERALAGLFEIQDELGPKIVQLLPVKVSEAEKRRVAQRYTRNLEAYEAFLRGQSALHVRRKADNETAREMFRRAIGLDAAFARAYAGLAMTYTADYRNQWATDGAAALARAFELARAAHQIDPDIPETFWVLSIVHSHRHEHDKALEYLQTAVRLHPSFADGYALMGGIYTSIGRPSEGVPLLHTAIRLAPESGYLYLMLLGRAYLFLGELEHAQASLKQALSRNPEFLDARVYMAAVHMAMGNRAAATWEAEEIRALKPDFRVYRWLETNPTTDATLKARLVEALSELGF